MNKDHEELNYEAYPKELSSVEEEFLRVSREGRKKSTVSGIRECTGVGLSGGGVRSATFCLGIFQGLATLKMLGNVDFISSVSGGGYFGSFYTRFFLRKEVPDFKFIEETLTQSSSPEKSNAEDSYQCNIINWLRENGRYLSPRSSGDMLFAAAVQLRNWVTVQIVHATFLLLLFLSAQILRIPLDPWFQSIAILKEEGVELVISLNSALINFIANLALQYDVSKVGTASSIELELWVSPFIIIPLLLLLLWVVPTGWAYWMVGQQPPKTQFWKRPVTGMLFMVLAALLTLLYRTGNDACRLVPISVLIASGLTAFFVCFGKARARRVAKAVDSTSDSKYRDSFQDDLVRNWISTQLKAALAITLAALAFVLFDSLGQTVYLVVATPGATLKNWVGELFILLVAIAPFATRIAITFGGANGAKHSRSTKIAAAVALFVIATFVCVTVSVSANAIAYSFRKPAHAPAIFGRPPLPTLLESPIFPDRSQPNNWSIRSVEPQEFEIAATRDDAGLWGAWVVTFVLCFLFGQSWLLVNRSTLLPLYAARLIRAYLGATNSRRFDNEKSGQHFRGGAITRVVPGDDIDIGYYWPWPPPRDEKQAEVEKAKDEIYQKGTPLHLVNVTINETVDGKSQVQQQDRKGIGMALGPAGISAGVRHHVVFDRALRKMKTFPRKGFRLFNYNDDAGSRGFTGERLSLGQWLTISGAGFSMAMYSRTNMALSLLTGFGNIRLGYWWDSGVVPNERSQKHKHSVSQKLCSLFTGVFKVQSHLFDEYTSRYHGAARKHWYLSDGGHFENMGGYELIRRRLRLIIIIDAEADPDYRFAGMANLIRKARIDFRAEIKFLEACELDQMMPGGIHCFSTLEKISRGSHREEKPPSVHPGEAKKQSIDPLDQGRYALAHAAIARISYDNRDQAESCLIYIKPTLTGDEQLDVLQYQMENPSFPQQPSVEHHFDEAQWESYRALGEHIAKQVFQAPEGEDETVWWETLIGEMLKQEPG